MATYTSYLNLEKPAVGETFNLLKINQNWDKIDQGVSALNSNLGVNVGGRLTTDFKTWLAGLTAGKHIANFGGAAPNVPGSSSGTCYASFISDMNIVIFTYVGISTTYRGSYTKADGNLLYDSFMPVQFLKHYDGNNLQIPFANYCSALCTMFLDGVGSATMDIRRTGSGIAKTHLAGLESVTNGLTLTVSEGSVTFSASNNMHFTLMFSNNT